MAYFYIFLTFLGISQVSNKTYLMGVLLLIGVFLPDLWMWSSTSVQLSWSQLDLKKGVFERDLDRNPVTVRFSILAHLDQPLL